VSWLIAIDKLLALTSVRWLLVVGISGCLVVTGYSLMRQEQLNRLNLELESRIATYSQQVAVQAAFVEQAGVDMEKLQKRLDMALSEAKKRQQELEKRKRELINMPLTGDCENMVQQVVQELKRR
jgi:hypothetical protein